MSLEHVVVAGASLAGLHAVEQLRKNGYEGRLTLVGAEPHLPYNRPPLSKGVLDGTVDPDSVRFRPAPHFEQLGVDLLLGQPATALDCTHREITLDDGHRIRFDGLIIATGATPRDITVPGRKLDGIHLLRTLDDARVIRSALQSGPRVVIVGAGVIGVEVASSARALGLDVTIVETQSRPMLRAAGPLIGVVMARLHEAHGARFRYGVQVQAFEGAGRVERVRLSDGSCLPADLVVLGTGADPAVEWLRSSGLNLRNGIVCDQNLRAGPPHVYAAGDVACCEHPFYGAHARLENWSSAVEQGGLAARNLLAGSSAQPCASAPYFWSDQHGARLQVVGHPDGDEVRVVEGSYEAFQFLALVRRGDRLAGAVALNAARSFLPYKAKVAARTAWTDILAHSQRPNTTQEPSP